jgi:hypothetical protein
LVGGLLFAAGLARAGEEHGRRPAVPGLVQQAGSVHQQARPGTEQRREQARIPAGRMSAAARETVDRAVRAATIRRSLAPAVVTCDAAFLDFALARPDVMVDLWRSLGISRLSLDPVAPGQWQLSDGYGTTGSVHLVHRERTATGGMCVFHARGGYSGPLSPRDLTGSCLVVVRYGGIGPDREGRERQQVEIDAFLQPLIMRSASANLREICLFVSQLTTAAARNPTAMARLAERMPRTPAEDRRAFAALAGGRPPASAANAREAEDISDEIAGRWMPVEQLDATLRR